MVRRAWKILKFFRYRRTGEKFCEKACSDTNNLWVPTIVWSSCRRLAGSRAKIQVNVVAVGFGSLIKMTNDEESSGQADACGCGQDYCVRTMVGHL